MNKKYFIAIVLPEPSFGQVEAFKQEMRQQFNLKAALRSPAHITLLPPFEWKEEEEKNLIHILANFKFNKDLNIELRNFNCFKPRVIFVDVMQNEILHELQTNLKDFAKEKLQLFNKVEDKRDFHPHVTIAFRDLKKYMFKEVWNIFKEREYQANFTSVEFALLKLEHKWEVIHRFPLS